MSPITVRFQETMHYDINLDCDVVRFIATTSMGSYWTEIPIEGPMALRRDRVRFKEMAVQCIQGGMIPSRIDLAPMEAH